MHSSHKPKISVVIPTLNEQWYIGTTLKQLFAQTYPADEIIIVDAHSTDKTIQEIKRYPKVKLFTHEPSVAMQRNYGAKKATGDVLIFLDADVIPPKDFIQNTLHQFNMKNLDCACPQYLPSTNSRFTKLIFSFFNLMFKLFEKTAASGAGCCIVVTKALWSTLEGFSNLPAYEDIEFIRRASKHGRFSMLNTSIVVSDRRFVKYGIFQTVIKYLVLSIFFIGGYFNVAQRIKYPFGAFTK